AAGNSALRLCATTVSVGRHCTSCEGAPLCSLAADSAASSARSDRAEDWVMAGVVAAYDGRPTRLTGTGGHRLTPISANASATAPGVGSPIAWRAIQPNRTPTPAMR